MPGFCFILFANVVDIDTMICETFYLLCYWVDKACCNLKLPVSKLLVKAHPNPSSQYFSLLFQSKGSEMATVKISDAMSRLVKMKTGVAPNSLLQIGH